jgi:hypothetical protein
MDLDPSMQFFQPGQPFDFAGYQAALRAAERERAAGALAPLGALPPRLNIDHYKEEAKARHKQRRASDRSAMLTRTQDELAREHGFRDWRKFSEAIHSRSERAKMFQAAVRDRNDQAVLATLEADPGAVVDVALRATYEELWYVTNTARVPSEVASNTLRLVGFALAKFGNARSLASQFHALHFDDFDWEVASTILEDRRAEAAADPSRQHEVEGFEEALSVLATYEDVETDNGPFDMDS